MHTASITTDCGQADAYMSDLPVLVLVGKTAQPVQKGTRLSMPYGFETALKYSMQQQGGKDSAIESCAVATYFAA